MIVTSFGIQTKGQLLPFYFIDEISTEKYTTTKTDRKKNVTRMPGTAPLVTIIQLSLSFLK